MPCKPSQTSRGILNVRMHRRFIFRSPMNAGERRNDGSAQRFALHDFRLVLCGKIAAFLFASTSTTAMAQEFSLFGGGSRAGSTNTYTWACNYQEGLGHYFTATFTWLNEGQIPHSSTVGRSET